MMSFTVSVSVSTVQRRSQSATYYGNNMLNSSDTLNFNFHQRKKRYSNGSFEEIKGIWYDMVYCLLEKITVEV